MKTKIDLNTLNNLIKEGNSFIEVDDTSYISFLDYDNIEIGIKQWIYDCKTYLETHFNTGKKNEFLLKVPSNSNFQPSNIKNALIMLESLYKINSGMQNSLQQTSLKKINKIFISHASKDANYIKAFVELLTDIGLPKTNDTIFCSSIEEYGIPNSEKIYDYIKKQYEQGIWVIFMLSDNYYKSSACLNEMGATWVTSTKYTSILLPEFEFSKIDGAIDPREISFKINDPYRLNEFKTKIQETFDLEDPNGNNWDRSKEKFLNRINELVEKNSTYNEEVKGAIEKVKKDRDFVEVTLRLINESSTQIHTPTEFELKLIDTENNTLTEIIETSKYFSNKLKLWPNENRIEKVRFENPSKDFNANRCIEKSIKIFY